MEKLFFTLVGAVIGGGVSLLSVWLTHHYSTKQFYANKLWEKKKNAYDDINEHLTYILALLVRLQTLHLDRSAPPNEMQKLENNYNDAKNKLREFSYRGAIIISNDVARELKETLQKLEKISASDPVAHIDVAHDVIEECLRKLKELADKDLKGG